MADNVWNPDQYGSFGQGAYDPDEEARKAREAAAAAQQPTFGSAPGFNGSGGFQGFNVPAVNQQANTDTPPPPPAGTPSVAGGQVVDHNFNLAPGATGTYGAADTGNTGGSTFGSTQSTNNNPFGLSQDMLKSLQGGTLLPGQDGSINFGTNPAGSNAAAAATGLPAADTINTNGGLGTQGTQPLATQAAPEGWSAGDKIVGMQQAPGQIVFGQYGAANPTNSTNPTNSGNAPGFNAQSSNPNQANNLWMSGFNNMRTDATPYTSGVDITDPTQAWQKFQFQNPTEDWQKNFNSIVDPVTRMRYAFQNGQGSNGEYLNPYLSQAGIDPATIQIMRSVFGASPGMNTREQYKGLGLNDEQMMNGIGGSFQQIGNQLLKVGTDGTKQLVQDFGNSGSVADSTVQNSAATRALYSNPQSNPWTSMHSTPYGFNDPNAFGNYMKWYQPDPYADSRNAPVAPVAPTAPATDTSKTAVNKAQNTMVDWSKAVNWNSGH